jgi:hypothetical protein
MQKKNMEQIDIINPLSVGEAKKLIDENRKSIEYWQEYLVINKPLAENEFYILFEDGLLVKKGRSKFKTSQYLSGQKYKSFANNYKS